MTQYKNYTGNPFLSQFDQFMEKKDWKSKNKHVNRGNFYFITEQEYYEEGRDKVPGNNLKSIEHNGVKYYYTPNISDKRAQKLAEKHPGGPTPSLGRDPGGSPYFSEFYPEGIDRPKTQTFNSWKEVQEYNNATLGTHLFKTADKDGKVSTMSGKEDLDSYTYHMNQLLDSRQVLGSHRDKLTYAVDPKKKAAYNNYQSQVQELESAILGGGVTSNPDFYEKFKKWYPEVASPTEYLLGQPVYFTDEQVNDYFYDKVYQYYYKNRLLSESLGLDVDTPVDELSPTQKKIIVMNGVVNPKLESSGIVTKENRSIIYSLSPAGKMALLQSGYMSPLEIANQVTNYVDNNELPTGYSSTRDTWLANTGVDAGITIAGVLSKNYKVAGYGAISLVADMWNHPYSASAFRWVKRYRENTAQDAKADVVAYNQRVLDAVIAGDNALKETLVAGDTDFFKKTYKYKLDNSYITKEDIIGDFTYLASKMPHYAGIKASGGNEFDNYPFERMIEDLSMYMATKQNLGDEAAYSMLSSRFQNYASDQQDGWDYFANTCLGFATEFVSTLGNTVLSIPTIPLGIADAVSGNSYTADYLNSGVNTYFQDIRQFNTFSPSEISDIKNAGGVSSYTNIRPVGEELKFWSPYTIGDVIEQGGQLASMTAVGGLTNYGLGKIGRMGDRTRNFFVSATSALGGAHSEAAGTFQEAKEALSRTLDNAVEKQFEERKDYELTKYTSSPQYVLDVNAKFKEYRESGNYNEFGDKPLRQFAEQMVRDEFLSNLKSSINDGYAGAREQIGRYAEGSYFQSFILNGTKTALTNTIVLKNVFSKPVYKPRVSIPGTYENNRLKLFTPKIKTYLRYGQSLSNVMLAEGLDEYFDGLFNDWATLTGNDAYSRYLAERWDMGAYMSNSSNWFSGLLTQGSKVYSNRFADQYIFEGAIGAFSAGGVNVNPVNAYKALRGQSLLTEGELAHNLAITNNPNLTDQQKADMLVDLTVMEKAGRIFGGAMAAMAEVDTEFRNALIEGTAAAENITRYWEDFLGSTDLVSKLLAAKYSEGEGVIDMKDAYDDLSLALATILVESEDRLSENGIDLQQLKELKALLLRAAEGDILDEDIDKFLSNPDNKAFLQSLGN